MDQSERPRYEARLRRAAGQQRILGYLGAEGGQLIATRAPRVRRMRATVAEAGKSAQIHSDDLERAIESFWNERLDGVYFPGVVRHAATE